MGVTLTDREVVIGETRIPRARITGIEFDRGGTGPGVMIFLGKDGELGRAEFSGLERRAMAGIEAALAPKRKRLRVFTDREAYAPGELVRGRVEVDWPKTRAARGIRVGISGVEETRITERTGSGDDERTVVYDEAHTIVDRALRLWGGPAVGWWRAAGDAVARLYRKLDYPELRAGRHSYPFELPLPARALPTYSGSHATVAYRLWAHVDIPHAFDLAFEGEVVVGAPRGATLAASRKREDRKGGWFSAELSMELKVEPCAFRPRERIRGRLFVENKSGKRLRGATIRLNSGEWAEAEGRTAEASTTLSEGYLRAPDPSAPVQDVEFALEVPPHVAIYRGQYSEASLWLSASLDVAFGFDPAMHVRMRLE